ncbi:pyridoxal phosphate-dependent aminotransferase [Okeania hirsuta]|uniref:Aminotransferase n=2 Tax=Microcoleaceae TaxID=1892252 RepID=A0A3N6Q7G5_9CYAN|nr:pyridoxal phosphate-dependent aminotransferase [Okeania hirsuta]
MDEPLAVIATCGGVTSVKEVSMKLSKEHYLQQLRKIVNPEQRAKYYKQFIDSDVVNLSTAENVLLLDFYQENQIFDELPVISATDIQYPSVVYGSPEYRQSILQFLEQQWSLPIGTITLDDIFVVSGVSAALECLGFSLFSPGDQVLIPGPMWYGFPWCFSQRPQMEFIHFPVGENFELSTQNVVDAVEANPNAKLLVLTNPQNPLGTNYSKEQMEEIYAYFLGLGSDYHIISDEIYACSQNTNVEGNEFVSAFGLDAYNIYPTRIHVVWGLSKDFGLSGFRVGCIISKSEQVQESMEGDACNRSIAGFSPFGSLNPYMLQKLFLSGGEPDPTVANNAISTYQSSLLPSSYSIVKDKLDEALIPYHPNNKGGIFFWIDLSAYLDRVQQTTIEPDPLLCESLYPPEFNDPNEGKLTRYLREEAQVLLVRGQECFWSEPGWFRLCYTAETSDKVAQGLDSMIEKLNQLPPSNPN